MIIELLLDFVEGGFNILVGLFPQTTFNPVASLAAALPSLGGLNYFLPIGEMVNAVVAFLVLGAPFMLVSIVVWVVSFIRGSSAQG